MLSPNQDFSVAYPARATLGEGALWDARTQSLLWVDILGETVNRFDPPRRRNQSWAVGSPVGTVVPVAESNVMVAVRDGFAELDLSTGKLSVPLAPRGHDPTTTRFNDGKCDSCGRFWAGTMSTTGKTKGGALYSLGRERRMQVHLRDVSISNGLAWNAEGDRMYYIDTPTRCVVVFKYDRLEGTISSRRTVIEVPSAIGYPDGMTIDAEGKLWIALWGGGAVARWDPESGRLMETYRLPTAHVTSCAFGGPELRTLYVTTARSDLLPQELNAQPDAGAIFAREMTVSGVPASAYLP